MTPNNQTGCEGKTFQGTRIEGMELIMKTTPPHEDNHGLQEAQPITTKETGGDRTGRLTKPTVTTTLVPRKKGITKDPYTLLHNLSTPR